MELLDINSIQEQDYGSIVFIDRSITNYQSLIPNINSSEIILLDSNRDGIEQITEALAQRNHVTDLHIISHGQSGNVQLGTANLNANTLATYRNDLQSWSKSLTAEGDILFYGCNLAAQETGTELLQQLSQLTQADLAASNDLTGNAALGGDWDLEVTTGPIENSLISRSPEIQSYASVLDLSFNYSNFSSISGLQLNGNASQSSNVLQLTPALTSQAGSAFYNNALAIDGDTSFQTRFQFKIPGGQGTKGADGLVFMLQNSSAGVNALGQNGSYLGYGSMSTPRIPQSLAIEVDTLKNTWDTNANHIALLRDGNVRTALAQGNPSATTFDLNNGSSYNLWIDYNGATNQLQVFLAKTAIKPTTSLFSSTIDLASVVGSRAFVGFSAGTGTKINAHQIENWDFTITQPATETTPPSASLNASNITVGGATSYDFTVTYSDNNALNVSSIDNSDLRVTGPNNFSQTATLVSVNNTTNGTPRTATYRLQAPGNLWDNSDNGEYTVSLLANQVSDTAGNFALANTLGTFQVNVPTPDTTPPTASLSASNITTSGATSYDFTVTYSDNNALNVSSIDNSDLRVTGPNNFSQTATLVSVNNTTNGTPRTATYRLQAPDNLWDNSDNGEYTVSLLANQVSDTAGNFALANTLGTFQVNIAIPNAGSIALEGTPIIVSEGSGTAIVTVVRTGGTDGQASVNYSMVNNTATVSEDYIASTGIITFADGETSKTVAINLVDDTLSEGVETFNLAIDNATGATLGTKRTVLITIVDNDAEPRTVFFDQSTVNTVESAGEATFNVLLNGLPSASPITVDYTTIDGTATAGNDYTTTSGTLTFAPGEFIKTITVPIIDNISSSSEANETFTVSLSNPNGTDLGTQSSIMIKIADDDTFVREAFISGLTSPTSFVWAPNNSSRMYIAQKNGIVRVAENGTLLTTPFINISNQVNNTHDRGLLSIAIHPEFYSGKPYIYLLFTYDPPEVYDPDNVNNPNTLAGPDEPGNRPSRLIRVMADPSTNYTTAVAGSEVILLGTNSTWANTSRPDLNSTDDNSIPPSGITSTGENIQDYLATDSQSHSIGMVRFAVDGSLIVSNGDGTSFNRVDPRTVRVQDLDNLSGKILRIDPLTGQGLSDNPFYNGDPNSNRSKVYNYGLRNPFRFTFHPITHELYLGDVGWNTWEEINRGRGLNFGWPYYEGGNGTSLKQSGYSRLPEAIAFYASGQTVTAPIYAIQHTSTVSAIVMGDFYQGTTFPSIYQNALFFTDVNNGTVDAAILNQEGNIASVQRFASGLSGIVQICSGPDSNLYYVSLSQGRIFRWRYTG